MIQKDKKTSRDRLLDVAFNEVYIYGYCGASTANILKKAEVPRGSMYHHFESKKALVLAMIEERLIPKVRDFFDFEMQKGATALDVIDHTMKKISKNKMLIKNGCPLHRLMFEMGALDEDISKACEVEFENIRDNFTKVLEYGMKRDEIKQMDAKNLAEFIISSSWGMLSRTPSSSSSERFLRDMEHIYILIKA